MLSVAAMGAKATMRMVKFGLRLRTWRERGGRWWKVAVNYEASNIGQKAIHGYSLSWRLLIVVPTYQFRWVITKTETLKFLY